MKKTLCISILILALVAIYDTSIPHQAVTEIKLGIINQDPVKLSEYIDFPILRRNLNNRTNSIAIHNIARFDNDPSASFAANVATAILVNQIDFFITPLGLASIFENRSKSENCTQSFCEPIAKDRFFQNAWLRRDSIDKYFVWIPYGDSRELKLILQRDMLKWKLVDINLNPEKIANNQN